MRKVSAWTMVSYLVFLFIIFTQNLAVANYNAKDITEDTPSTFELKNGDRVVLLGNSLMENDLQYGYIEFALTSRWPACDITFRNLGWSGDTVFGDARSYFTSPPNAYQLLIEQLTKAKPTVVFLAYGANEAYQGQAGLSGFVQGLNQLLDKIDSLGAKTVLLSPTPLLAAGPAANDLSARNENLKLYASAIAKTASERDKLFIDLFNPLQQMGKDIALTNDGVHLNEMGYYYLASVIETGLGLPPRKWAVTIDLSKHDVEATVPTSILDTTAGKATLKFTVDDAFLPLPLPEQQTVDDGQKLKIAGLKKGCYTLTVDGAHVASATAKQWSEGVDIRQGTLFSQANLLQDQILKKNELFFQQYRPLNRTYLIGFRSYEQGRHGENLQQLDLLITWLEGQIAGIRSPKSTLYQLTPIQ